MGGASDGSSLRDLTPRPWQGLGTNVALLHARWKPGPGSVFNHCSRDVLKAQLLCRWIDLWLPSTVTVTETPLLYTGLTYHDELHLKTLSRQQNEDVSR